ncbi:MAG TPA: superinfection immunity protein [Desulfobulbus sp.]|nr:superinfection immunity protein [Desulfobulbus sp.]
MSFIKLILSLVLTLFFLLPSIIAVKKNHPHKIAIIFVNIFGGLLYGLGWIVAFIWCFLGGPSNKFLSWGAETYRAQKENFDELTFWGKVGVILGMMCLVGLWCAGCLLLIFCFATFRFFSRPF